MQKLFENWREFSSAGDVISEADAHDARAHASLSKIGEELKNKKKESYISGRGAKNLEKLLAEFTKKNKNNLLQDLQRLKKDLDHQRERSSFFKKELTKNPSDEVTSRYLEREHTKYKQGFESYNKHYQKLNKIYTSIENNDLYRAFGIGEAIVSGLDKLTLSFAKNEEEFNVLNGRDRHSKTNTLGTYLAHKYLLTFNPKYINPKNIEQSRGVIDHELEHAISHIYEEYMMKLVGASKLLNQPGEETGRAYEAGTKTRYGKYMEDLIYIADIQLEKLRKIFAGPINPMISQTPSVGDLRKEPELAELIKLGFAQKGTLEGSPDHNDAIKKWKYGKYETWYGKGGEKIVRGAFPEYHDRSEELRAYAKEFRNSLRRDVDPEGLRAFCRIRNSLEEIRNTFPQLVKYINKNGYTKAKNRRWREKGRAGPSQSFIVRDLPNLESDIRKWYNYFQKSAQKFPEVKKLLPKKFDIEAILLGRLPNWIFWMGLNCSDADSAAKALNTLAKMDVGKEPGTSKSMIAEYKLFNNMQKLFESWREFRKEVLSEATPGVIHDPELHVQRARRSLSSRLTKKEFHQIRQIISLIEPTGVASYPEVAAAFKDLNLDDPDEPTTLLAVGAFLLAAAGAIPLIGKAASPAKAAKLVTASKTIKSGTKILDQASDSKKIISQIVEKHKEALESLSHYMHTTQGFSFMGKDKLNTLLKMARGGKAVGYSGKAYRGARADDVLHLVDQLNIPGIAKRDGLDYSKVRAGRATWDDISNQADAYFKRELQKMYDKPGEWVEISLPTKGITLGTLDSGAASFTKNWKSAEMFADTSQYANKGDKFEIIFQTSGDNFVDAAKTLDKHGLKVADDLRQEAEVLAIGEILVEKIFVRRII